jgi:hypothetical protein
MLLVNRISETANMISTRSAFTAGLYRSTTTRAGRGMAGAARHFAACWAGCLAGGFGQVQFLVADQAHPIQTQPPVAGRWFGQPDQRVPVEPDQSFPLAPANQHVETLYRHK